MESHDPNEHYHHHGLRLSYMSHFSLFDRYGNPEDVKPPIEAGEEWKKRPLLKATLKLYSFDFFKKVVLRHDTGKSTK